MLVILLDASVAVVELQTALKQIKFLSVCSLLAGSHHFSSDFDSRFRVVLEILLIIDWVFFASDFDFELSFFSTGFDSFSIKLRIVGTL